MHFIIAVLDCVPQSPFGLKRSVTDIKSPIGLETGTPGGQTDNPWIPWGAGNWNKNRFLIGILDCLCVPPGTKDLDFL